MAAILVFAQDLFLFATHEITPCTFLFLNLLMISSCTSNNDPKPPESTTTNLDVLVKAHGYWEWKSSISMGSSLTPITVGFTRQLVFKSDSLVHIYHNQQLFAQPRYGLGAGLLSRCGQPQIAVPLVRYTAEAQCTTPQKLDSLAGLVK